MAIKMLTSVDIYDLYGCSYILDRLNGTPEDNAMCAYRIDEIWDLYVTACKERIKAEAKFLGVDDAQLDTMTITRMTEMVTELIIKEMHSDDVNDSLMRGGTMNFAKMAIEAQRAAGMDMGDIDMEAFGVKVEEEAPTVIPPGIDVNWFDGAQRAGGCAVKDPKWHEIAKAYVRLEEAGTTDDKIQAIVNAGATRLTPVLLTALSTILGLMPLAIGMNINFIENHDYNASD